MSISLQKGLLGLAALAALGFSAGCHDKLTHERFSQLKLRASDQREVEAVIGEPDEKLGALWYWERPDKHVTAMIDFDERGLISRKRWNDGRTGAMEDTESESEGDDSNQSTRIRSRSD